MGARAGDCPSDTCGRHREYDGRVGWVSSARIGMVAWVFAVLFVVVVWVVDGVCLGTE